MIMSVNDLRHEVSCGNVPDEIIKRRMDAIEAVIRQYTNNNFQQRKARFAGSSSGSTINGVPCFIKAGDTVQISESDVNDGLYVVTDVGEDYIQVDGELLDVDYNLVTKIHYPPDVAQCAVDLFVWKQQKGDKVGVKSETLSRHSVTYEDSATLYMGYPVGILNGLKLYRKARC